MKNVLASLERAAVIALGGLEASGRDPAAGDRGRLHRCFPETAAPVDGCLPQSPAPGEGCFPGNAETLR